jgi:molybdenum cofactor cytidylyltransferase
MQLCRALRLGLEERAPDVVTIVGGGGKTSLLFRLAGEVAASGSRVITATTTRVALHQLHSAPASVRMAGDAIPWDEIKRALDEHGSVMLAGTETLYGGKQSGVSPSVIDTIAAASAELGIGAVVVEGDGSRTLPVKAPGDHEPVIASSTTVVVPVLGLDALGAPIDEAHTHRPERIREVLDLGIGDVRLTPALAARLLLHTEGGAKSVPGGARLVPLLNKADGAVRRGTGRVVASLLAEAGAPSLLGAVGNAESEPILERWGPITAIVLAAGGSSRFGTPKQMSIVDGERFVHRAARVALESGANRVIVVAGAAHEAVSAALGDLVEAWGDRLRLRVNPVWAEGQSTSVRTGMEALDEGTQAAIFLPVDQPHLDGVLLRRLMQSWRTGAGLAAPVVEEEVRGAPALFDRSHFAELRAVSGDRGGREVLHRHAHAVQGVPALAHWLLDVDLPDSWNRQAA